MGSPFTGRPIPASFRLKQFVRRFPPFHRSPHAVVFAPPGDSGGVKSLYSVCDALNRTGRCAIVPFDGQHLVRWFPHDCRLFNDGYAPEFVIYPEIHQPNFGPDNFHICFALGQFKPVAPHADLVVVKSPGMRDWVKAHQPHLRVELIPASINRAVFDYDGRPKRDLICYMTRAHKHPETAVALRERYGDKVVEIVGKTEAEVAEILKSAKVFVWRGYQTEASPRPPKEALVAGCHVVGLAADLCAEQDIDFGIKCRDEAELLIRAGEALALPPPGEAERARIRDIATEMRDWLALMKTLNPKRRH